MVTRTKDGLYEFRFFCPRARQVHIVGDFNGWDRTRNPMSRQHNGDWVAKMRLPEGAYQFKYHADGEWYVDYAAFGIENAVFGCNSVLVTEDREYAAFPVG